MFYMLVKKDGSVLMVMEFYEKGDGGEGSPVEQTQSDQCPRGCTRREIRSLFS